MLPQTRIGIDGKRMCLVPEGWFLMGTSQDDILEMNERFGWKREWFADELPQHRVYLDDYYIDETPVTNAEYKRFLGTNPKHITQFHRGLLEGSVLPSREDHPVVFVSWLSAQAYAQWAGKRLPTEAEWEKAARGGNGQRFPWGDLPDPARCNSAEEKNGETVSVVRYAAKGSSPFGVMDMAGNVWEWCADYYAADYYKNSPERNPTGPANGDWSVLRGGAWDLALDYTRCASRDFIVPEGTGYATVGFRCVMRA